MTERLIKRAKKGDSDAFCQLMDLQMQSLYKIAWSFLQNDEDAADVIQDTVCTCYEKLGQLHHNRYFKTWLIRILINKCNDFLRTKNPVVYMPSPPELPFQENKFTIIEWQQLFSTLDEKYRTILVLYYMENFQVREIAEILDLNENTVKSRLLRGRHKLLESYQK